MNAVCNAYTNKKIHIDYKVARAKARQLIRCGFGRTIPQMVAMSAICAKIGENELTQLVAISYYVSVKNKSKFYNVLQQEFTNMGVCRNRRKKQLPASFEYIDLKEDIRIKQLHNLYRVMGFELFYKYVPNGNTPKGTIRKWCNKAFAARKNEKRGSLKTKREVERFLRKGAIIRFSEKSSSVYIKSNEGEIRISDHKTSETYFYKNIILQNAHI